MILTGGRGYEHIYHPDAPKAKARKIAVHRLVAYAHGEIDRLDSHMEIDHMNRCKWDNRPDNLQAVEAETHGRITRSREVAQCD